MFMTAPAIDAPASTTVSRNAPTDSRNAPPRNPGSDTGTPATRSAGGAVPTPERGRDARYRLCITVDPVQVRAAQRLRHLVFAEELGAVLGPDAPGLDTDGFDRHCDHLIVWDDASGEAVGTYRMLPPGRHRRLYSDGEFDLAALAHLRQHLVEVGRSCVHPDHRNGAVLNLMWTGLARYMSLSGLRWMAGCASVPIRDTAGVWRRVSRTNLAPAELRVRPYRRFLHDVDPSAGTPPLPPLLRGYLRLGAWVCGPPALDPDFGVGDLFVLLDLDRADGRYLRHFLGERAGRC